MANLDRKKKQGIAEYVQARFHEYTSSGFYQNWKVQGESIRDALDQRYRKNEQLTRSGFYLGDLRARRDGLKEGFTDIFGQASPLLLYQGNRGVDQSFVDRVTEAMRNTWEDISGLQAWLGICDDAIDFGMGVSYQRWAKAFGVAEAPVIRAVASAEMFEFSEEHMLLMDAPEVERVHPYNWRGDVRRGDNLRWEGIEREYTLADMKELAALWQDSPGFDAAAMKRVIDRVAQGKTNGSTTFYSTADEFEASHPNERKAYAKEYWGDIRGVDGMARDPHEYQIVVIDGETILIRANMLRMGAKPWRPIKRTRLAPLNDIPIGRHVLAPNLPHQRIMNLITNLGIDDVMIRQHLGLAYWPSALKNPNDMLNPEGARGVVEMKDEASANQIPRMFADQRSGVLSDALQMMGEIQRDNQRLLNTDQDAGLSGGAQGDTATQARLLASASSRKTRGMVIFANQTGLRPIAKDLTLLTLRNKQGEAFSGQMNNDELFFVWHNNLWEVHDSVVTDRAMEAFNLEKFANVALEKMSQITTQDGSADHVVKFIKDYGRKLGIPTHRMDEYFPEGMPPQVQQQQQPQQAQQPQQTPSQEAPIG